jgi:Ca-activated chloride channel homolog
MKLSLLQFIIFTISFPVIVFSGNEFQLLREANKLFEAGNYVEAEAKYREVLEMDDSDYRVWHNLGNALYHQGRLKEAAEAYNRLVDHAPSQEARAAGYHNLGNSLLGTSQIAESIDAYKHALRLSPDDEDTRYNLAYALNLLDEMPPEESGEDDSEGEEDDDGEEQQQNQSQDEDGEDKQQERDRSDDQGDQMQDEQMADRTEQLTPEDAERILEALRQQEEKVQEEIKRETETAKPARIRRQW